MSLNLLAPVEAASFDIYPNGIVPGLIRKGHVGRLATECRVCLGPHDDEIHRATERVRQWFRDEVNKSLGL